MRSDSGDLDCAWILSPPNTVASLVAFEYIKNWIFKLNIEIFYFLHSFFFVPRMKFFPHILLGCLVLSTHVYSQDPLVTQQQREDIFSLGFGVARKGEQPTYYDMKEWDSDNGLPSSQINVIYQSRNGYLWLGTEEGLTRFDGIRFVVFDRKNTPALRSASIRALVEDNAGALWIATHGGGLSMMKDGKCVTYTNANGLPSDYVSALYIDRNGRLWIGTDGGGLAYRDGDSIVSATFKNGRVPDHISKIKEDPRGDLLVGTFSSGFVKIRGGEIRPYSKAEGLFDKRVTALYGDAKGNIWAGTTSGLFVFTKNGLKVYRNRDGIPEGSVEVICEDRTGKVWIGTKTGLCVWIDGKFRTVREFIGSSILSVIEDAENNLWVGKETGLTQLRITKFVTFDKGNGLPSSTTITGTEDVQGNIWVGTTKGLSLITNRRVRSFTGKEGLTNGIVTSVCEDKNQTLWIGTFGGLNYYRNDRIKAFPLGSKETPEKVYAIYEDRKGKIWIGTSNGLYCIDQSLVRYFGQASGLSNNDVRAVCEDHTGILWVGTSYGLHRMTGKTFTVFTSHEGLSSSIITSLYVDTDNVLWIGTYGGGLNRFKDGKFFHFNTGNGFYDDVVYQILEDEYGYFWMTSNKGVYRVKREELNDVIEKRKSAFTTTVFGKADGLPSTECSGNTQPAGWRTRDGRLWFPTSKGVAVIDPLHFVHNQVVPPVVIEQLRTETDTTLSATQVTSLSTSDRFEIDYTALSYQAPDQVHFRYKLERFDEDWIDVGTRRTAYYNKLPAGRYTFRVTACNNDQQWNEQGASLALEILPPFWMSWWFRTGMILLISGIIFSLYQMRMTRLRKEKEVQQEFTRQLIDRQESERKRIAAELHDSLGQNILIMKHRASLGLQVLKKEALTEQLREIETLASETLDEVREIAHNLRPIHLDRLGLTETVRTLIAHVADASSIQFDVHVDPIDDCVPKENEINIFRILQEGLNNILKHSGATEASINIFTDNGTMVISVHDNGKGFVQSATDSFQDNGSGFGLTGIAERVRILEGHFSVHSAPGNGTMLEIRIPLNQQ